MFFSALLNCHPSTDDHFFPPVILHSSLLQAVVWLMLPKSCFCHSCSRTLQWLPVDDYGIQYDSCIGHSEFSCSLILLISDDYNHESYHLISIYNTLSTERMMHYFLLCAAISMQINFIILCHNRNLISFNVSIGIFSSFSHHPMVTHAH